MFDAPPDGLLYGRNLRAEGADGLLLLHVVHKNARGRSGTGVERESHTPAFGIAIPAGGPNFSVVVNYQI